MALASGGIWDADDAPSWAAISDGIWVQLPTGCFVKIECSAVTRTSVGYAITLTAAAAQCVDKELFVFQRKPNTSLGAYDEFSHVASPSDLVEYPAGRPANYVPFYRLAAVTLVFRSLDLLMQSLQDIKRDVCLLLETVNQMDELSESQLVIDGVECEQLQ